MERLESKIINGNVYYYYSKWAWKNGRCRRIWQKYLGKLENIVAAVQGVGPTPLYAEVFQWGLPMVVWKECATAGIIEKTDFFSPKRNQGLTVGEYLSIAAINRAISPTSKRSMWEWFSKTVLLRRFPNATPAALTSQRFWDHMEKIDNPPAIWQDILIGVVKREEVDLSSVSYDGTNFFTFIDTFNTKCTIAKRGKNKQGRNNLRQVSYALFCSADSHIPLYYDIYEGNRNDAKQFPIMLKKFQGFLEGIAKTTGKGQVCKTPRVTLVFDKGNNSADNFLLLDSQNLSYVGSVKAEEHKELALISNNDERFTPCDGGEDGKLEGTKSFRIRKIVYGKERILVVAYNQNLFNSQFQTVQNDMTKAIEKLSLIQQRLEDRANGLIKGGKAPTTKSIEKQCHKILSRQYLKGIIKISVPQDTQGIVRLKYSIDSHALAELCDTYLGKNIIITNRDDWDDSRIITAYRSQFIIENVFKEMKDRNTGSWWPLLHWTDSKIRVHSLYCTIALLLRALIYRRIKMKGVNLSIKRILMELDAIREVVNVYPKKTGKGQKKQPEKTVLTKTSPIQKKLMEIFDIKEETLF